MRKILLDTDVLINFLRGRKGTRDHLVSLMKDSDLYCSALTVAEIHAGMKEHEREKTSDLLDSLAVVDINRQIAEKAGHYKRAVKSQTLELDDCLIAATAFIIDATLATSNAKHFPMRDIEKHIMPGS